MVVLIKSLIALFKRIKVSVGLTGMKGSWITRKTIKATKQLKFEHGIEIVPQITTRHTVDFGFFFIARH